MKKPNEITIAVILILFFVPGVYGLKVDVSAGSGGSSSTFQHDFNLADDASVEGEISVDQSGVHPTIKIIEPKKQGEFDYGDLNIKWWKWAFSMPINENPLFDTAECSQGQSGNVWFIGSGFVPGDVYREITIPTGKRLFIPLSNGEASTVEGEKDGYDDLKATVDSWIDGETISSVEIDGSSIEDFYRAPSDLFEFGPLPNNNVLQFLGYETPEGTISQSAADGYYMMLNPLTPGDHSIKWESNWQNVDFKVHVTPGGK